MMETVNSNNSNSLIPRLESQGAQTPQRSKSSSEKDGFTSELAQAQAGAMAQVQQAPAVPTAPSNKQELGTAQGMMDSIVANQAGQKGEGAIRSSLTQGMAEKSPLTQDKAASLNTASVIAGLKPWSKDWVFPEKGVSPEMKPLFGASAAETQEAATPAELAQAQQAYASLVAQLGDLDLAAKSAQAQANPAGARSDTEAALAAQNQQSQLNGAAQAATAQNASGLSLQQLQQQLQQMGGNIEKVNGTPNENGTNNTTRGLGGKPLPGKAGGSISGLSGSEFLGTLSAAKAGGKLSGGDAQLGQDSQNGGSGGKAGSTRANLKLIGGGRDLEGKRSFEDSLMTSTSGMQLAPHTSQSEPAFIAAPVEVAGHVVKGRMSQDRLSSESLIGVSAGIKDLTHAGGGEMRIRLKPENLGELHVRVVTDGNNVGLQFQASDENAKKILEESMTHLKESLSVQNLSLGSVDVTVAHAAGQSQGGDMRHDQGQQNQAGQHAFNDMLSQNQGRNSSFGGNSGGNRWDGDGNASAPLRSVSAPRSAVASSAARAAAGRLDVRA